MREGGALLFEYRRERGNRSLSISWTLFGDPTQLEASLMDCLEPKVNDRDEGDPFSEDELLNRMYML